MKAEELTIDKKNKDAEEYINKAYKVLEDGKKEVEGFYSNMQKDEFYKTKFKKYQLENALTDIDKAVQEFDKIKKSILK